MTTKTINIEKYRGKSSSTYTGRPQGLQAREELNLDVIESNTDKIIIQIPAGTTSFNPSFYLGLFYKSYKKLTYEVFKEKYKIDFLETDEDILKNLRENIEDGERNARNELNKKTGFAHLILR